METPLRSSVDTVVADTSRAFGTFVGLLWLCVLVGIVATRAVDTASVQFVGPVELLWAATFVVAALGTTWLEGGGYERLGADPDGGPTFAWLVVLFVPLAFLPLWLASTRLLGEPTVPNIPFVLFATLLSGWLAFYGGLERLDLESDDFTRVFGYVVALGVPIAGAAWLFDDGTVVSDPVAAALAIVVQAAACWLGVVRRGR
ncbi:hypothetical protein [Natronolimnohabitans innermongolicus]|uniref:Uncharacterized protein n=1 Tax=Natronolimnohabitans innermongolicus JCM 12255 TaxID=1227499 RepID=L9WX31_9EURY|nr:hypothetical protein [Natronolimnohabitans innermongolicus]ELY54019.1 hypothetical protein C493_13253 [Natronolimnohabitans innermongolicus JCM 12255]